MATKSDTKPTEATADAPQTPEMVWVITVNAPMLHLYTNVLFTKDPKKVELDDFVKCQVAAGKLELTQP